MIQNDGLRWRHKLKIKTNDFNFAQHLFAEELSGNDSVGFKDIRLRNYCVISIAYGVFILLFHQSYIINFLTLLFQVIYFAFLILKKKYSDYLVLYLIFSSMSLEFEYMSGQFYGWRTFRLFGISASMWLILPLFTVALINIFLKRKIKFCEKNKIAASFVMLNCIAIAMGLIMLLSNDNGVTYQRGTLTQFALAVYENLTKIMVPAITFAYFLKKESIDNVKKAMVSILVGITIQEVLSLVTGIMATMWADEVPMAGPIQTFAPFLLLFGFFEKYQIKMYALLLGAISCLMALKYSFGSGQFIILFSVPVWIALIILERRKIAGYKKMIILGAIIIPIIMIAVLNITYGDSIKYKLNQAISMLTFWRRDWLSTLPNSARFRIEEIRGIIAEYIKKPYYLILGKGFMGTFTDAYNYFFTSPHTGSTDSFSAYEWSLGAFYNVHESFNNLLLTNGLLGVTVFFRLIVRGIKNIYKSPFIAIGIMWLVWYWGYSLTYSYFGIACLFLGFGEINKKYEVDTND